MSPEAAPERSLAVDPLGRGHLRGTYRKALFYQARAQGSLGLAKIGHDDPIIGCQIDPISSQIAMHDRFLVSVIQGIGNLLGNFQGSMRGERSLFLQDLSQGTGF